MATFYQSYGVLNTDYIMLFLAVVGVAEIYSRAYKQKPSLVRACLNEMEKEKASIDVDEPNKANLVLAHEICCKQYLVCMLL